MLDLDEDNGFTAEDYLNTLITKAPTVASLLHDIRRLSIFKGFFAFVFPTNSDADQLSKAEVTAMLSQDSVDWEQLHTDLLAAVYDHRATKKATPSSRAKPSSTDGSKHSTDTPGNSLPSFQLAPNTKRVCRRAVSMLSRRISRVYLRRS